MSQTLIDALDALESQVASLSRAVKAADPGKISQQAEAGARNGAIYALGGLPDATRALQAATTDIKTATNTLKNAAEGGLDTRKALGRWKVSAIALATLLSLLAAFTGGISMAGMLARTYPALVTLVVPPKVLTPTDCKEQNGSIGEQNGKSYCAIWFK